MPATIEINEKRIIVLENKILNELKLISKTLRILERIYSIIFTFKNEIKQIYALKDLEKKSNNALKLLLKLSVKIEDIKNSLKAFKDKVSKLFQELAEELPKKYNIRPADHISEINHNIDILEVMLIDVISIITSSAPKIPGTLKIAKQLMEEKEDISTLSDLVIGELNVENALSYSNQAILYSKKIENEIKDIIGKILVDKDKISNLMINENYFAVDIEGITYKLSGLEHTGNIKIEFDTCFLRNLEEQKTEQRKKGVTFMPCKYPIFIPQTVIDESIRISGGTVDSGSRLLSSTFTRYLRKIAEIKRVNPTPIEKSIITNIWLSVTPQGKEWNRRVNRQEGIDYFEQTADMALLVYALRRKLNPTIIYTDNLSEIQKIAQVLNANNETRIYVYSSRQALLVA